MTLFDSGLLISADFRKSFVSKLQGQNNETEQIRRALLNFKYTFLNNQEKLLLGHDLINIFVKNFYDFEHGSLLPEESSIFRSDESLMFFSDYFLYFSFISSFYERPKEANTILEDISSSKSRKAFFSSLREPLSPYLFITFIHNLIDSINLGSPGHDCSSIEYEMCRQIIINAKELCQLQKFNELYKNLLEKIKSLYKSAHKSVTNEMENSYSFYFAHSFYKTISFPSDQFHDPEFKDMTKNIYQILRTNSSEMNPIIEFFSDEKDLLSYHTYIYQRYLCIDKPDSWIYPSEESDEFLYPAQLRLSILSKKVGDLMGNSIHPIGNSVVKITFPSDSKIYQQITVGFNYNNHSYTKHAINGIIEVVFPCFKDIPLEISFIYNNKCKKKNKFIIPALQNSSKEDIEKIIKLKQEYIILINHKFYTHDKPIENLTIPFKINPTNLFNLVAEAFIHKYLAMNANFTVIYRNEDCLDEEEEDQNPFKPKKSLRIIQDISGRAFPIDFWLFLCDIAIKYSIPSTYFFARLVEKLTKCWCNSQAYINLYCIMLYNFFYSLKNSEHSKKDEELFTQTIEKIRKISIHLLMSQLAKPEIYQRPSITSLMLILSLSNNEGEENLIKIFESIFVGSKNNIKNSVYNLLKYKESETECTSMFLYSCIQKKKVDFPKGPNGIPLCNIDIISLRNALDLVLYRSRSISLFYLESFLPSFANLKNSIMEELLSILLDISSAFIKINPIPDQNNLIYFVSSYQQLYQLFNKNPSLNPAVIFNQLIENWMFDLSTSTIEIVERSIEFDTFEKKSEKSRISDSFIEIFEFFNQNFFFITSLNFKPNEIKDKLLYFLSLNSAICSYYIESLLSIAANQFRGLVDKNVPLNKKSSFPSWCPERSSKSTVLKFEDIAVVANNISAIRLKWLNHIIAYEKYLPNHPQIIAALSATAHRRDLNDGKDDSSSIFLLKNVDESSELISSYTNFAIEGTECIKDPCYKISSKVNFILNFLRLDLTFEIIEILHNKMWGNGFFKSFNSKQLRESFFNTTDLVNADNDNISKVFEKILDIFKEKVQKVKNYLQVTLYVKCLPQLVRGLEDGIFECMIPLAFSTKSKNIFQSLTDNIEILYSDAINYINECEFGSEIVERCVNSIRLLPYVRSYLCQTVKDVNNQLKIEKDKFNGDYTYIILLSIVIQVITSFPFPKMENSSYTFISLE